MIQHQHWSDNIRILITDEQNQGSVQVCIPTKEEDKPANGRADALIHNLWVNKSHRRHGAAKRLLEAAEKEAKLCGAKSVALAWEKADSPLWVLQWYERLGYDEAEFSYGSSLLVKRL